MKMCTSRMIPNWLFCAVCSFQEGFQEISKVFLIPNKPCCSSSNAGQRPWVFPRKQSHVNQFLLAKFFCEQNISTLSIKGIANLVKSDDARITRRLAFSEPYGSFLAKSFWRWIWFRIIATTSRIQNTRNHSFCIWLCFLSFEYFVRNIFKCVKIRFEILRQNFGYPTDPGLPPFLPLEKSEQKFRVWRN